MIEEKDLIVIIENLLEEHDCIILPKFGGFVVQKEYYKFIPEENVILPKKRWIAFNQKLQTDDGFLSNEIALQLQISNKKAQNLLEELVENLTLKIKENTIFTFGQVGSFAINENQKLQFTPNLDSNFEAAMFGLPKVSIAVQTNTPKVQLVEPPIAIEEKIEEEEFIPMVSEAETRGKKVKNWVYASIFFLVAGISTFVLTEPEAQKYTSSLSPFPSISSSEYITTHTPEAPVANKMAEKAPEIVEEKLEVPKEAFEIEPVHAIELIAGSFLTKERAEIGVEELQSKGIEKVYVLEKKDSEKYYRISIGTAVSMEEGYTKAANLKKEFKLDIWVFENKQ